MLRFSPRRLRAARRSAGLRTGVLAVKTGRSKSAIEAYETGRCAPRAEVLAALASVLNCRIDDLFEPTPGTVVAT